MSKELVATGAYDVTRATREVPAMVIVINRLVHYLDTRERFEDLDEAEKWLLKQGRRIVREVRVREERVA